MWRGVMATMLAAIAVPASAGLYGDDLSRCLVRSAGEADRTVLMQWMFSAYAASDAAKDIATMTRAQHDAYNAKGAALFQRLMLVDCRKETVEAIRYEGMPAIQASFETLGQIAGRGLMTDPKVAAEMERFGALLDADKFTALGREAGVPMPAANK